MLNEVHVNNAETNCQLICVDLEYCLLSDNLFLNDFENL